MSELQRLRQLVGRLALLTRPQIAAQAAAYTVLGAYLGPGLSLSLGGQVATAAFTVALIVSFGFVINDYADVEVDRLTKPSRPLPAGVFTRTEAALLALGIALSALAVALTLPMQLLMIAGANLFLTALYALVLKGTVLLGNLAVAVLNGSILVFGSLAAGGLTPAVLAVASMSLLYTLAQEVLYTVDDLEGDRAAGLLTTAVYFGVRRSLYLFCGLMLLAIAAAAAPIWLGAAGRLYLPVLLLCTVAPLVVRVLPLAWRGTPEAVAQACALVKIVRLSSLVPLIVLQI